MKIEDMIRGESKNIEFKEILPSNSEKYTKTIVAFANTQGGKLIIGITDQTRKIVGVDEATLSRRWTASPTPYPIPANLSSFRT